MIITQNHLDRISEYQPQARQEETLMRAAVAMILRDGKAGTEFLLMQRAIHPSDPWSGQMAFPGGKIEPEDKSAKAAAIREVEEEVGIKLRPDDYIGRLDDTYGLRVDGKYSVHVACFVFKPKRELFPIGNYEVEDLVWLPFSWLHEMDNAFDYPHPKSDEVTMPAVMIDEAKQQILWGLSLRMLSDLYALLELSSPVLDEAAKQMKALSSFTLESKDLSKTLQKRLRSEG